LAVYVIVPVMHGHTDIKFYWLSDLSSAPISGQDVPLLSPGQGGLPIHLILNVLPSKVKRRTAEIDGGTPS